jgi:hypothetical protein
MTLETSSFPNGIDTSIVIDESAVEKTAAYTVVITTDSGKTFYIKTSQTFTLPGIAIGNSFTFVNMGEDGKCQITIDPDNADGISYAGANNDGVTLINTLATSKKGDYVRLASLGDTGAWQVTAVRGIWAKGS